MNRILIVDDEKNMRSVLELLFQGVGWATFSADSAERALELVEARTSDGFNLIISDLRMQGMDGIEFLRTLRERGNGIPFILITAYGTVEKAVEGMKLGAVDVLTKPFAKETILEIATRSLNATVLAPPVDPVSVTHQVHSTAAGTATFGDLIFTSPRMSEIATILRKIGPVSMPVLLTGESGTGKEVVARSLHAIYSGGFDKRPFISVNCPAVPEQLLESELFGYRKGAFTGANQDFRGKVEMANGGTLFFDEIGDLPSSIQPKLLRLLENRSFEALGSGTTRQVEIRVVCATNRDLRKLVQEGRFREDLYYRINTFTLDLPPLRDRPEDIPTLAEHFLGRFALQMGKTHGSFSLEVMEAFQRHTWPGNVRELRNVVERSLVLATGADICLSDLPTELAGLVGNRNPENCATRNDSSASNALEAHERRLIHEALEKNDHNVSAAARSLGISRNTLRYRMQKHGFAE